MAASPPLANETDHRVSADAVDVKNDLAIMFKKTEYVLKKKDFLRF